MAKNDIKRDAATGQFIENDDSVFLRPIQALRDRARGTEAPVILRNDVHERALNAAKRALRAYQAEVRQGK